MIKINLLAEGKRPAAVRKSRKPAGSFLESENVALVMLLVALLVIGVLPAAGWWWAKNAQIEANEAEISTAQREVDELAAIIKEVEEYKAKQAELERKISVIEDLRRSQRGPVQLMDAVSRALPELLWLDKMTMNNNQVSITGRAFNPNAIASFAENLDQVPEFREPIVQDIQQQSGVYNFAIVFEFSYALPPAEDAAAATAAGG